MLALILAAILGSGVVYFSMQNQALVTVQLGNYLWSDIPLYLVTLGALLVGLAMAWIVSAVGGLSSALTIWGKENEVHALQNQIKELRLKLRDFSIENARLKGGRRETQSALIQERIDHTKDRARSFFDRLRHRLSS